MRDETGITPLYFRSKREFGKPHPFTVIWPAPMRPHRGVPLDHSLRPSSLRADQRLTHGELIIVKDVEGRAVGVAGRSRRDIPVPVVYEALRDSDPLEDGVWRAYQMATDGEHSRTPIRVLYGHEQQACTIIHPIADVVIRQRGCARGYREAHEAGDLVRPARGRGAARVEGLPGPSASHVAIAEVAGCVKGSLPGQRDRRAILGYRGRDPAWIHRTGGEVDADDVPEVFLASRTSMR